MACERYGIDCHAYIEVGEEETLNGREKRYYIVGVPNDCLNPSFHSCPVLYKAKNMMKENGDISVPIIYKRKK